MFTTRLRSIVASVVTLTALVALTPTVAGATTTIVQSAPTSGAIPAGQTFADQLLTTGQSGAVVFTVTSPLPTGLTVSAGGALADNATTPVGVYTVSGTDADTAGNTGTWAYTLTVEVDGVTLVQATPTAITTPAAQPFTLQLVTTGQLGTESFIATPSLPTGVSVSTSGLVSGTGSTPAGTYTIVGTASDTFGGTGTWSLALTVTASTATITQVAPTAATAVAGSPFSEQLATTGGSGPVSFALSPATLLPTGLAVSPAGVVSSTGATPVGTYTFGGTTTDAYGAAGTWDFTLTVTAKAGVITQVAPVNGTTTATSAFSVNLAVTGQSGPVSFSAAAPLPTGIAVSATGVVTSDGTTPMGVYPLSGVVTDTFGDAGTWAYTLTITADGATLTQAAPTAGTAAAGVTFEDQLNVTSVLGPDSYAVTSTLPGGVQVSATGRVTTTTLTAPGVYPLSGTVTDPYGGSGIWSFTLTVTLSATVLSQSGPLGVNAVAGTPFATQLTTTPQHGVEYFTATVAPPTGVSVSSSGLVSGSGTTPVGAYLISGTVADTFGGTGTWSFTLVVSPSGATVTQVAPFGSTTATGQALSAQIATTGQSGAVSFVVTGPLPTGLNVTSSGVVTVTAGTPAGSYTILGTDSDAYGARGTWSYTIDVSASTGTGGTPGPLNVTPVTASTSAGTAWTGVLPAPTPTPSGSYQYVVTSGSDVLVSTNGTITAPATLRPGVYTTSGIVTSVTGATAPWSVTITVLGQPNLIEVAPPTRPTSHTTWTPRLRTASGAAVSFTSTTPTTCVVVAGTVTFAAPGTCSLVFTTPATALFDPVSYTLAITVRTAWRPVTTVLPGAGPNPGRLSPADTRDLRAFAAAVTMNGAVTTVVTYRVSGNRRADLVRARALAAYLSVVLTRLEHHRVIVAVHAITARSGPAFRVVAR